MDADVIVVGDGPAGCAAAMTAARAGLAVVMLGRGRSLDAPEYLSRATLTLLETLAPDLPGTPHCWLDAEPTPESGRAVMRGKLDHGLRIAARDAGAQYLCLAAGHLAPHIEQGRISGARRGDIVISSPVVIDASGCNGWLRRSLRLEESVDSPALWLQRGQAEAGTGVPDPHWHITEQGWLWLRTTSRGKIWTSLSIQRNALIPWPTGVSPTGKVWRDCRRWRCLQQAAGPGYFVCGDAAVQIDPATGDGCAFAIESGARAAMLAAQLRRAPRCASLFEALYSDWVMQFYLTRKAALAQSYANAALRWPE